MYPICLKKWWWFKKKYIKGGNPQNILNIESDMSLLSKFEDDMEDKKFDTEFLDLAQSVIFVTIELYKDKSKIDVENSNKSILENQLKKLNMLISFFANSDYKANEGLFFKIGKNYKEDFLNNILYDKNKKYKEKYLKLHTKNYKNYIEKTEELTIDILKKIFLNISNVIKNKKTLLERIKKNLKEILEPKSSLHFQHII